MGAATMRESLELPCEVAVDLMPRYLDDELTEPRLSRFEQHIVICRGCQTFLAQLQGTIAAVARLRPQAWQGVADRPPAAGDPGEMAGDPRGTVTAYKFLSADQVSPFARVRWPDQGARWLSASDAGGLGWPAVYACRSRDLAYWLGERLWRVELAGNVTYSETKIAAERGRLISEVGDWPAVRGAFIKDCAARLADLRNGARRQEDYRAARKLANYAAEIEDDRDPASVGYTVAHAAELVGWLPGEAQAAEAHGEHSPFTAERGRQSRWLVGKLGLSD